MNICRFDHVNIRTAAPEDSLVFWRDILGLSEGPRPTIASPGVWLYSGDQAIIHLIFVEHSFESLGGDRVTGPIDHIAMSVADRATMLDRIRRHGLIPYGVRNNAKGAMERLLLHDPNGITVELLFQNDI